MTLMEYMQKHRCIGTPQFRLLSETAEARVFLCLTCHEIWTITRSKLKAQVREEKRLESIRQMTEAEREANRRKISGPFYSGRQHAG